MSQKKYKFIKSKYTSPSKQRGFFSKFFPLFPLFPFLFGFALIGYIGLNNHISSQAFVLRDLEHQSEELRSENERLELRAHELSTSTLIEERLGNLPLVKLHTIEYLSRALSQVAVR